jgi:hypothetical protein
MSKETDKLLCADLSREETGAVMGCAFEKSDCASYRPILAPGHCFPL